MPFEKRRAGIGMLVLQRKKGQSIVIGGNITISILETGHDGVKISIDAPSDVTILRKELQEAIQNNQEALVDTEMVERFKELLL